MKTLYAVILAGGRGERFWPLSQPDRPKPFLNLLDPETLIEKTLKRIETLVPLERTFMVIEERHLPLVKRSLGNFPSGNLIVEPYRRDTAAAIGLSSLYLERRNPEAIMLCLPSDHYVPDEELFSHTILKALPYVKSGEYLLTMGIRPTRPETGYGYIERGDPILKDSEFAIYKVAHFKEKPNLSLALEYIKSENFFWNSGMFLWKNRLIQSLFFTFLPLLGKGLGHIRNSLGTKDEKKVLKEEYQKMESISIDYGVLEKAENVLLVPAPFRWDDIGSWASLERICTPDEKENIIIGNHKGIETQNCIVYSQDKLIATIGVSNLVIVEANQRILVCTKENCGDLKRLIPLVEGNFQ